MREKWSRWYRNWSRQLAAVSLADFFTLFIYLQVIGKGERGGGRGATDVCPLMHKKTSHAHFRLLLPSNDIICFRVKNFQLKNKQICYYSFVISLFLKTETTFFLFLREVNYLRRSKEGKKGASACRVGRLWLVRGKAVARSLRRLRKRHLKKLNSRFFKLYRAYCIWFNSSNIGTFFWS